MVRLIEVNHLPVKRAIRWLPAMPKLLKFFEDLIDLRRREPDDRLITKLIAVEEEGGASGEGDAFVGGPEEDVELGDRA